VSGLFTGAQDHRFHGLSKGKSMKQITHLLAGAIVALLPVLALGLPSVASAVPVTLTNPSAGFSDPVPVSGDLANSNITWPDGVNGDEVRFGVPTTNSQNPTHQQSGLRFDVFAAPMTVETGVIFDLGVLSHFNWEVATGTSITGATLTFTFGILNGTPQTITLPFLLGVDETNNVASGCANTPVPAGNWCPDIISFPNMGGSSTFVLGGQTLTLNLFGFGPTADEVQNDFITQEFTDNTTHLWASISTPSTQVPEPGSLLMMALGLLGLGGVLTYRQKRKDGKQQG
jgi:hypothetical protein